MKKFLPRILAILLLSSPSYAKGVTQYPSVTGDALVQFHADRVISTKKSGVAANNAFIYIEPNISLNFNKNWSIKTGWRIHPNSVLTTRNSTYPERYRTVLQEDRGFHFDDNGLLVEELKLNFENRDMEFFIGKFDPKFGTAHNKRKRIGVFTSQFTEDYNLREKIGTGVSALLERSKISFSTFFNDTTGLADSALDGRGRPSRSDGLAGNTGTLSSYVVKIEGEDFFGIHNLIYNIGYRSLSVDDMEDRAREQGYVFGAEYLYKIGARSSIIPFIELVKINNFTGASGRGAFYKTAAIITKYRSWIGSVSYVDREVDKYQTSIPEANDRQLQLSVGYKFTNNIALDVTRAAIKEDGYTASVLGFALSYLYEF